MRHGLLICAYLTSLGGAFASGLFLPGYLNPPPKPWIAGAVDPRSTNYIAFENNGVAECIGSEFHLHDFNILFGDSDGSSIHSLPIGPLKFSPNACADNYDRRF